MFCTTMEKSAAGKTQVEYSTRTPAPGDWPAAAVALLPELTSPPFLDRFRQKGRLSPLLRRIPLHVVTRPNVGLFGALHFALAGDAIT